MEKICTIGLVYDFDKYEVVEIGSDDYRNMEDIAKLIGGEYEIVEPPPFLTPIKKANFDKIKLLGWKPEITLEESIEEMKIWHQKSLS